MTLPDYNLQLAEIDKHLQSDNHQSDNHRHQRQSDNHQQSDNHHH
jgi:hypothetical protein